LNEAYMERNAGGYGVPRVMSAVRCSCLITSQDQRLIGDALEMR